MLFPSDDTYRDTYCIVHTVPRYVSYRKVSVSWHPYVCFLNGNLRRSVLENQSNTQNAWYPDRKLYACHIACTRSYESQRMISKYIGKNLHCAAVCCHKMTTDVDFCGHVTVFVHSQWTTNAVLHIGTLISPQMFGKTWPRH